jgi:hypothetical protein
MGVEDGFGGPPIRVRVIGSQNVKLECYCGGSGGSIWLGGTDFATATSVAIPASGTKEIIFNTP